MELNQHFSFYANGYKFMPKYKMGLWDGKIYLFSLDNHLMYQGLRHELIEYLKENNYTYQEEGFDDSPSDDIESWVSEALPRLTHYALYDHQKKAVIESLNQRKALILSPTGSGKSLICYALTRYLLDHQDQKILIVVPTVQLVEQLQSDFRDYSADQFEEEVHGIYSGKSKQSKARVYVSTYQSLYKMPHDYYSQFGAVIVDECHQAEAKSIRGILEKCKVCPYKIGMTGTLKDAKLHTWSLKGLFGEIIHTKTTKELMDEGVLSAMRIVCVNFRYSEESCRLAEHFEYQNEIDFIVNHPERNRAILDLACGVKGNTLVLFNLVDKHGKKLHKLYDSEYASKSNKQIRLVYGGTDIEAREAVRELAEREDNVIILASYGVFSTGISIKNIHNLIFAHPLRSKIKNIQSIGRVLRKLSSKNSATVFDLCDNLSCGGGMNITLRHFIERLKLYKDAEFDYTILHKELT